MSEPYPSGPPQGSYPPPQGQPHQPYQNQAYPQQGGGYPPPPPYYGMPPAQSGNGLATAALVLGIIAVIFFWFPFLGMILAILSIIFGGVGIARANRGASGKGQAVAGLVLGLIAVALYALIIIVDVSNN